MSADDLTRPRVGVLAVQGAVSEHEVALADVGARTSRVRRSDELDGLDGLVIPGGESTTFGLVAGESGLLDAVRERIDAGMPTASPEVGLSRLWAAWTSRCGATHSGVSVPHSRPMWTFRRSAIRPCAVSSSVRRGLRRLAYRLRYWPSTLATSLPRVIAHASCVRSIRS